MNSLWFRKKRGWFVTLDGQQVKLGDRKSEALKRYKKSLAKSPTFLKYRRNIAHREPIDCSLASRKSTVSTKSAYRSYRNASGWLRFNRLS